MGEMDFKPLFPRSPVVRLQRVNRASIHGEILGPSAVCEAHGCLANIEVDREVCKANYASCQSLRLIYSHRLLIGRLVLPESEGSYGPGAGGVYRWVISAPRFRYNHGCY